MNKRHGAPGRDERRKTEGARPAEANESARGVMDVMLDFGVPIANGILTTDDEAQANARLEKGAEAVRVALEMAKLKGRIHEG